MASLLSKLILNRKIYFKLHPEQFDFKNQIQNELRLFKNIIVISCEMSDLEIFTSCNHVIGVRSTMLYSALQSGKYVYLYKIFNYDWDKIIMSYVDKFENAEELNNLIKNKDKSSNNISPIFFEKFQSRKFNNFITNN